MPTVPPSGRSKQRRRSYPASIPICRLSRIFVSHPKLICCRRSSFSAAARRTSQQPPSLRPSVLKMKPNSEKSQKDKGKGPAGPSDDPSDSDEDVTPGKGRSGNWIDEETEVLLDAVGEYKLLRGLNHINIQNFAPIHRIFKSKLPGSSRTKENCKNRVKHLKQQYNAAKRYTTLSGGDCWDYTNHKLNLSSQTLEEIIQTNEKGLKFLRRPFPWFAAFETLCGGIRAQGDRRTLFGDESDDGEGSGSTDNDRGRVEGRIHIDRNEWDNPTAPPGFDFGDGSGLNQSHHFSNGFTQQESQTRTYRQRGTGSASKRGTGSFSKRGTSSGSKRKSSDSGSPSVTRGKRCQGTYNQRTDFFSSVRDNDEHTMQLNNDLLSVFRDQVRLSERKLTQKGEEIKQCIARMNQIPGITRSIRIDLIKRFNDEDVRNYWLYSEDMDLYPWIELYYPDQFSFEEPVQQHTTMPSVVRSGYPPTPNHVNSDVPQQQHHTPSVHPPTPRQFHSDVPQQQPPTFPTHPHSGYPPTPTPNGFFSGVPQQQHPPGYPPYPHPFNTDESRQQQRTVQPPPPGYPAYPYYYNNDYAKHYRPPPTFLIAEFVHSK